MRAYRFRLDSVLRVRALQQRVAAQQLAVAAGELHRARAELDQALRSLSALSAPTGHLTAHAVHWSQAQSERMSGTASERSVDVATAEEAARQATQVWGRARQRTVALERLDERHFALWQTDFDRAEIFVLDELTTARTTHDGCAQ